MNLIGMDVTLERTRSQFVCLKRPDLWRILEKTLKTLVASDIIGLYDIGNFQIGDSIYTGKKDIKFEKLPQFTPELFMRVTAKECNEAEVLP